MVKVKRTALYLAGFLALLLLLSIAVLPGFVKNRAIQWVHEETGRKLIIESIGINPFTLSVEVRGLQLSGQGAEINLVAWELLRLSLDAASAFHGAPIIDELFIDKPDIRIKRLKSGAFNFSDLLPASGKTTASNPKSEPLRFSIDNISINEGRIDFVDESLDQPHHSTIESLQLILPSLGNLPHMIEDPSQPKLSAVVNGSPFLLEGYAVPFTDIQEMAFDIKLDSQNISHYLDYVATELPVSIDNGKLNLDIAIVYTVSPKTGSELELSGTIDLISLDIRDRLEEKLFFLPLLQIVMAPSRPLMQEINLASVRAYNLEVQLNRDQQGEWNHARMAASQGSSSKALDNNQQNPPFRLAIDTIEIRDGVIHFEDRLPPGGFKSDVREINIDVHNFALDTNNAIPLSLSLKTDRDEIFSVTGSFLLNPFTLTTHCVARNFDLGVYSPYYSEVYSKPFGGRLEDLAVDLEMNPEQPLLLSSGQASLRNLQVEFNASEGFESNLIEVDGLTFDAANKRLDVDYVAAGDTSLGFSRDADGRWSFLSHNFPILAKSSAPAATGQAAEQTGDGSELSLSINDLSLTNWNIDFTDELPTETAHLNVRNLSLNMGKLTFPDRQESPLHLSAELVPGGKVTVSGRAVLAEPSAALKASLTQIPLKPFAPYLAEQTNMVLASGRLNAELATRLSPGDVLDLTFEGRIGIELIYLLDGTHREDLLKWDNLLIAGIEGSISPPRIKIESITLSEYFAKVLIDEDARLNLIDAISKRTADNPQEQESGVDRDGIETAADQPATAERPDIQIARVTLQGGQIDFTDRSLPRPFHADMTKLGGRIDGLSSQAETQASVDLRGSLRNQSPLSISGQFNPLAEDISLDIELNFLDIEMSPFSPYSGNYLGYLIEKGKLNLTLDYVIADNQLQATNTVFLNQFDFGEAVESENAINLPVRLAVALLKDAKGEIHLDIPVYGNINDPKFSIAGVVWKVIRNLLVKAATSPFSLLGSLVGGDEDFSTVTFAHGSTRLANEEQDKLLRLALAFAQKPSLQLEISGFVDPENDPEGFRQESLRAKIKRVKYIDLLGEGKIPEGLTEAEVDVSAEEYQDYLWEVYKDEDFPKPRNFIGMTKRLPAAEMEKLIYANTRVDDNKLAQIAQTRALAVQSFLVEQGGLSQERVFLKKPDITTMPEGEAVNRARVELGASIK